MKEVGIMINQFLFHFLFKKLRKMMLAIHITCEWRRLSSNFNIVFPVDPGGNVPAILTLWRMPQWTKLASTTGL